MAEATNSQLQSWIERMNAGDPVARDELINHACDRLRRLTHQMLGDFGRLRPWEDTGDVLQNSVLRLLPALKAAPPASVAEFFHLAARQIRRELIDLARHYFGPQGLGANRAAGIAGKASASTPRVDEDVSDTTLEPSRLARWTEFHGQVDDLPNDEREVFDLLWYQGLTQGEAAGVLEVSTPTIKRRWLSARLRLQATLRGEMFGL